MIYTEVMKSTVTDLMGMQDASHSASIVSEAAFRTEQVPTLACPCLRNCSDGISQPA